MNIPSHATIARALPGIDTKAVKRAMRDERGPGNKNMYKLDALSTVLCGFGVESIHDHKGRAVCWYVNMGDTYAPTVMLAHNRKTGRWTWRVGSWGDWVEAQEKQGRRFP